MSIYNTLTWYGSKMMRRAAVVVLADNQYRLSRS